MGKDFFFLCGLSFPWFHYMGSGHFSPWYTWLEFSMLKVELSFIALKEPETYQTYKLQNVFLKRPCDQVRLAFALLLAASEKTN